MNASLDQDIAGWLARVTAAESPHAEVVAFNVGLIETQEGFSAYLCGSTEYDEESGDWACEEAWTPSERYFPIPEERYGISDWQSLQSAVVTAVRDALRTDSIARSFLGSAVAVTVGFDEGDLERVA
jgi:hypothetical protein